MPDNDPLYQSLRERIAELERQRDDGQRERKRLKNALHAKNMELKELGAQHNALLEQADAGLNEWEEEKAALAEQLGEWESKAKTTPTEQAAELERLKGELLSRDHRDAWSQAVGAELQEKVNLADVWQKAEYKPEGAIPPPEKIAEWVKRARDAAPYLFRTPEAPGNGAAPSGVAQGAPRPPLKVDGAPGRGARDTAQRNVQYRRSEVQAPDWENTARGREITAARLAGTAELVPE